MSDSESGNPLFPVRFQIDWYPQAEHGGFYYALVMGYYKEEGLDVDIIPGGLTLVGVTNVVEGKAEFGLRKTEGVLRYVDQGMPLRIVMASMQHDPQGILIHENSPIQTFKDLNGRKLIGIPGGAWITFLQKRYDIEPVLIPNENGMERFLSDDSVSLQSMITGEPFAASLNGVKTRFLLLSDSGYDSYHVVYTTGTFATEHPDVVRAFVRASIRGWQDYLTKNPSPAFELIKSRNARQTGAQLNYARNLLIEGKYAMGEGGVADYGLIDDARMRHLAHQLLGLGLIKKMPDSSVWSLAPEKE